MTSKSALLLGFVSLLLACQGTSNRDLENYGDVTQSPGGIALVSPDEHVGGWGRKDCLLCHNVAYNVHRDAGSPLNVDQLNQLIQNNGYSSYCLKCHGPNGISP